jgi:hypothetical protein
MSTFKSVLTIAAATAVALPATAQADGFTCTASAVRGSVLGKVFEPARAGSAGACATDEQSRETFGARTGMVDGKAVAATTLSGFKLGSLDGLALPQVPLPAGISALPVPLPAAAQLLGLPSLLSVDATEAARALIDERTLPDVPAAAADLVHLGAGAACDAGRAVLDGLADVQGLTALGKALPADRAIDTAVPLAPAQLVDFAALDVDAIALPGGLSLGDPVVGPILRTALESVVAGLPSASVPAELARVVVEPARREDGAGSLRQVGPRVRVSALGRELVDVTLGDALVGALCDLPASPAPAPADSPVAELALSCAPGDVVLTDVVEKDGKVKLVGLADARFVGRTVDLVLTSTGQKVASAVVEPDGYFRARAPLPANRIRWSNKARYQAVIEGERSMALKLHRRMRITRMKPGAGFLTITGRVYGVMGSDRVVIARRESCTKDVEVTQVKPGRDGRWRVTLPIPEGVDAATYRATTTVLKGEREKRFRTFSLPGHVAL